MGPIVNNCAYYPLPQQLPIGDTITLKKISAEKSRLIDLNCGITPSWP